MAASSADALILAFLLKQILNQENIICGSFILTELIVLYIVIYCCKVHCSIPDEEEADTLASFSTRNLAIETRSFDAANINGILL